MIVGAGVRVQQVYGEAVNFLGSEFGNRKVALNFCCSEGGTRGAMIKPLPSMLGRHWPRTPASSH